MIETLKWLKIDMFAEVTSPSCNVEKIIWIKVKKSSKGQDQKTLVCAFVLFLTAIAKVIFLEGKLKMSTPNFVLLDIKLYFAFGKSNL